MTDTAASPTERAHRAAKRYIYAWGGGRAEGDATMRDLLGGKGAGLAEMTHRRAAGAARLHDHDRGLQRLLRGRRAAPRRPLGRRPRGGPRGRARDRQGLRRPGQPAPGQRPLGRQVLDARDDGHGPQPRPQRADAARPDRPDRQRAVRLGRLPAVHPDVRPDRHGRRRRAVRPRPRRGQGGPRRQADTDLDAAALREVADAFKTIVRDDTGRDFPTDPYEQLDLAIKAVFASWFGKRAHDYRENQKIAHDLGTAVNVVTMVFGNMGDDSGTGVAFTRDPNTGEKVLFGEYLTNAQGEDVVAGIRTPQKISHLAEGPARAPTTSSSGSPSGSSATTATSRTSSSRSSAAGSTCSRPGAPSGPPRRP